ncbi:hypothetical protein Syun_009959 [Stephania yunnanensis]|uniref:Uncharacterized protein n=1 Tax=Stephania yunnanensis TaxID=152371 RepID=A0AAP0KI65_9MAGN
MACLDMDVLPEKTITNELIERYGKVNCYEDVEDMRERVEIAKSETEQRKKIRDDTRKILEEKSEARNDPNEYHLYGPTVSYWSQRIDLEEDDDDATSGC